MVDIMLRPIMAVINQNKTVSMIIQSVVIEVFVVDEDVVPDEVESQRMKSL
jgi:hypothetical protein